ncbi:hypothetical protein Syun_031552 [Stephania yunnanensis]|uniref:Rubisco LSMT substrate-binding domain-containing protein n=1 Tax=Stephania yunnanensis TaxID=152371 RepID=A0AAP0E0W5_9MAGN
MDSVRNMGNSEQEFSLLLTLSKEDPLYEKKRKLLDARGFDHDIRFFLSSSRATFKSFISAARIIEMDEAELYFAGVDVLQPVDFYSPTNELKSLNSLLSHIDFSLNSALSNKMEQLLRQLKGETMDVIRVYGDKNRDEAKIEICNCRAENLLLQWGKEHGLKTKLQIAHVEGAGRGAVAVEDLTIGDTVLEIPESIIISEEHVYVSEMFEILKRMDDISAETMLLLWSMKERHNPESKFKFYFDTLPKTFNTGLDFGVEALTALEGTLLFDEIIQAKEHLRSQYDTLCPLLCRDHPDVFQPEFYSWDQFLWACELWYSNSMKVIFTDGKLRTCLVPFAGLLNHSLCPHVLHYGRVTSSTKSLKFALSRPCRGGDQCYLSYGNFSSSHLITFYGFLPKGNNFYDVIPMEIDVPQADDSGNHDWTTHMVRGTWLSSNHEILNYGLPPTLLNYLRSALKDAEQPKDSNINIDNEREVLETLYSIFNPMMEGHGDPDNPHWESPSWDVKLALEYKDLERRIISSVLQSCLTGLEMLQLIESKHQ